MTIDEIKSVSIRQWLKENNYGEGIKKGIHYYYNSPFRTDDKNPSFSVDPYKNLWLDWGPHEGGNLITLVQKLHPDWSMHQVLSNLDAEITAKGLSFSKDYEGRQREAEDKERWIREQQDEREATTTVNLVTDLTHPHLRSYILQRRIDYDVAQRFCKEVHYSYGGKTYYSIAFMNIEDGMEARNKYSKRCIGKKTISKVLPLGIPVKHCCVFEGFFDMLTYITMERWMDLGITNGNTCDYFVLNSCSCLKTLLPYLKEYDGIHCYLDNDETGKATTKKIIAAYPDMAIDESYRYSGYKDLNDVLCGNPIKASGK